MIRNRICFNLAMYFRRFDYPDSPHRYKMGLYQFCWTIFCGYDFRHALLMGNIYWKLWKQKIGPNDA